MARKKKPGSRKAKKARIDLFGPPPLFFGESEATYNKLLERVNVALKPTDIFEEFAAWDIANSMMGSLRFARLKPELINANMYRGLEHVLKPLCHTSVHIKLDRYPMPDADLAAAGWAAEEPSSIDAVEEMMNDANVSMDAVVAETLSLESHGFEEFDRMAMNARRAVTRFCGRSSAVATPSGRRRHLRPQRVSVIWL